MIGVIQFLLFYCPFWFITWVLVYRGLYRQHARDWPSLVWDNSDRSFGVFWGGFVAFWWPIVLPAILFWLFIGKPLAPRLLPYLEKLEK